MHLISSAPFIGMGGATITSTEQQLVLQCRGGETKSYEPVDGRGDVNDECCSDTTWSEATYRLVKGDTSTQHYLEQRIHDALWLMSPEEIGNVAWDAGLDSNVAVSSSLISRAAKAVQNFVEIFQPDRWVRNNEGMPTDCTSRGYYATWEDHGVLRPDVQLAAVKRIIGPSYTPEKHTQFAAKANTVIWGVTRNTNQTYAQPGLTPNDLFTVVNGQVNPTVWMAAFLNTFAPIGAGLTRTIIRAKATRPSTTKIAIHRQQIMSKSAADQKRAILAEQGTTGITTYVIVGVGVVAIAGAIWYFGFRK